MWVKKVKYDDKIKEYLERRWLFSQFKKVVWYIVWGMYRQVAFKLRQPKQDWIYQFKINGQFRALGTKKWETLYIFHINNHQ